MIFAFPTFNGACKLENYMLVVIQKHVLMYVPYLESVIFKLPIPEINDCMFAIKRTYTLQKAVL